MKQYLQSTQTIDWQADSVLQLAHKLATEDTNIVRIARSCFEWVRDRISHSGDQQATVTTCRASDVLQEGTGWCFAKSHLLAALLRANEIPAGLCYQRLLCDDGRNYMLHGLNAVYLPEFGWYRIDARGNKQCVDAQFCPPREALAWTTEKKGEVDLPEIWPDPVPVVVRCLQTFAGWKLVSENLPDIELVNGSDRVFRYD